MRRRLFRFLRLLRTAVRRVSGWPRLLYPGDSLDYYGHIDGVARWERAKVLDSGHEAGGSGDGADDAGGSDEDGDGAIGQHEDANNAAGSDATGDDVGGSNTDPHAFGEAPAAASALTFAAPPTTEPVSSAIGASVASGASGAREAVAPGGAPAAS